MLKGVAEFYRNYPNVKKDADGKYHIHDINGHEPIWGAQDTLEEVAGMRGVVPLAIRASEILDVDPELRAAWREFLQNKIPLAFGTDYPVEPITPFRNLYAAVTRKNEAGTKTYYPEQKLTIDDAIARANASATASSAMSVRPPVNAHRVRHMRSPSSRNRRS